MIKKLTAGWRRFGQYNTFLRSENAHMLKEKNHEHCHTTSKDIWSGDVVTYKISERETGRGTKKNGEMTVV